MPRTLSECNRMPSSTGLMCVVLRVVTDFLQCSPDVDSFYLAALRPEHARACQSNQHQQSGYVILEVFTILCAQPTQALHRFLWGSWQASDMATTRACCRRELLLGSALHPKLRRGAQAMICSKGLIRTIALALVRLTCAKTRHVQVEDGRGLDGAEEGYG